MNSSIVIKPLSIRDIKAVLTIEKSAYEEPWPKEQFEVSFASKTRIGFGYFKAGQLVAYVWCSLIEPEAEVLNIAVLPESQGQGIGKKLLSYAIDYLQEQGMRHMFLEVRSSNARAIKLYHSLGFSKVGLRKGYYASANTNTKEDAVLMQKVCS